MSIWYSIDVLLEAEFNIESVSKILNHAQKNSFLVESNQFNVLEPQKSPRSAPEEAAQYIFKAKLDKSGDLIPSVIAVFDQMCLEFFFNKEASFLVFSASLCLYDWEQEFDEGTRKDFARYLKVLLDMCADFPIYNVNIRRV